MQTQQQLNFGVTLDNGDHLQGAESARQIGKYIQNKKPAQTSTENRPGIQNNINNLIGANSDNYTLSRANNPGVCISTLIFKGLAFFIYFFLGYLMSSVLTFIFTVIMGSLDFWVVKNISGRILVGLRWSSIQDQKGNQKWKFQSHDKNFIVNSVDSSFFWTSQIIGTLVWGLLLFINILQLDLFWALLIGINFGFCTMNLYGYYMCRGEHKKKIGILKQQIGKAGLMTLAGKFM